MDPEHEFLGQRRGQFDLTSQPDIGRIPLGADHGRGCALGAEAAGPAFPAGVVEARLHPVVTRLLGDKPPLWPGPLVGRGHERLEPGGRRRREQPGMGLPQHLLVDLADSPVVGEQAVDLDLNVGRLGVDGRRQPLCSGHRSQALEECEVGVGEILHGSELPVAPVGLRLPGVARHRQA